MRRQMASQRHTATASRVSWAPIFFVVMLAGLFGCQPKGTTPEAMSALILEALPAGSDRAAVNAFLETRHADYVEQEQGRVIVAMIRQSRPSHLVHSSLRIRFSFDEGGRLVSSDVQELFTGP